MMAEIFALACAISAIVATFSSNIKTAVLALWVSGLAVGGLYLTLGTDTLAVIQWIVATLVAVSFVFFSMMYGEFSRAKLEQARPRRRAKNFLFVLLGGGFAAVVSYGILSGRKQIGDPGPLVNDLASMGKVVADRHFLSFEVLALLLFLVLIGAGVIARPEAGDVEP